MTIAYFNKVSAEIESSGKTVSVGDVAELLHDLFHECQEYIPDACIGTVSDKFTASLRAIDSRGE